MAGEYKALTEEQQRLVLLYIIDREFSGYTASNLVNPGFMERAKDEIAGQYDVLILGQEKEIELKIARIPTDPGFIRDDPEEFLKDLRGIFREIMWRNPPEIPDDVPAWEIPRGVHALPPDTPPSAQIGEVTASSARPAGMSLMEYVKERMGRFIELAADDGHESAAGRGGGDGSNLDPGPPTTRGR